MRQLSPARQRGLTLVELMVGLGIAAFLALSAAPHLADYATNSRLREAGNLLYSEALLAQSEAIKRNRPVRLASNGSTVQVLDIADPANPVQLRERTLPGNVSTANAALAFGSEGRPVPFGTSAAINLSISGITCSSDQRCPGLRVDAGGAIRLCANHLDNCS
ncbi:MAG: GspH/FimT family pseudopilin [Rubrivivax sp.]|nr:GspH/FimT family pseudopilin [Rubrivivax sp.]MDP3084170.1 GspH/FimT family pseudopilin [Rubrivivax sp.]